MVLSMFFGDQDGSQTNQSYSWAFPIEVFLAESFLRCQAYGFDCSESSRRITMPDMLKGLDASKDQELLSYLLIHRDRPHSREALASLLWADTSTEKSKKYLRQALWHLHAALNSDHDNHVLLVDHDWLSLNPCSTLWTDVADFERAFAGAEGIAGRQLDAEKAHALKRRSIALQR